MGELTHSAGRRVSQNISAHQSRTTPNWPYPADYGLGLVCIHGLDGRLLSVSPTGAKTLGYEPQEMVGRHMQDFLAEDVRDQLPAYLDHIRQQGTASGLMRVMTKSGDERILAYSNICRQETGEPAYVLGHATDITELKKAEQQLRVAEQRFRSLLQCSSDVVTIAQADGNIKYVSPAVQRALGYSPERVIGRNVFDYVHPEDLTLARATFDATLQKPGYAIPVEVRLRNVHGAYIRFDVTSNNLLHTPGVGGVVIAARDLSGRELAERESEKEKEELEKRDRQRSVELAATNRMLVAEISEREQAEKALRESQSLLQATLESTADGILVVDMQGKIVSINRRFVDMWGIPEHALNRRSDAEALEFVVSQLKSPAEFRSKVNLLYKNSEQSSDDVLEFKDGRVFERYSQPQKIAGQTIGRVWSFRDVTERKRLEEHLRQAQKMEAIGRLAGGIAHDFNNLLMVIMGHCKELKSCHEDDTPSARHSKEQIFAAAERAASLTKQLLAFSRRQVLAPRVLDVNLILTELSTMLRRLIGEDIELLITPSESPAYVRADPAQLDQVIVNLVVNARDAMPKGGRLTLTAQSVELRQGRREGTASVPPGNYVLVTVADVGIGMSQETLSRIFEPFFTTKELGQGTGLGLATAYGIVRQSHGYILVESELGRGTTFEIYLPRLEALTVETTTRHLLPESYCGSETILLVEDEEGIRILTKAFLEQQGYTVLEAGNGLDALSFAKDYPQPIHLLLTDVVMPGIRGTELAERLLKYQPTTQILYVSGYSEEEIADPAAAFLQKPFPMEELGAKIRQVLDKGRASAV
jgi:two-component system, cell cycle sensor histidine kinase and response regulator CckA